MAVTDHDVWLGEVSLCNSNDAAYNTRCVPRPAILGAISDHLFKVNVELGRRKNPPERRRGAESSSRCAAYARSTPRTAVPGKEIYYDRRTVLRQLGVFHEPQTILGQISILATHPVTIARAIARKLLGQVTAKSLGRTRRTQKQPDRPHWYSSYLIRAESKNFLI
jgi:hypothetical protein